MTKKLKAQNSKLKTAIYCLLFALTILLIGFSVSTAGAADPPKASDIDLPNKYTDIGDLIQAIITWLLGFGGALAVIAIIYSGIMYITAGADQTKAENAKKNLIWAITGIVVVTLAYVIITWIHTILTTNP